MRRRLIMAPEISVKERGRVNSYLRLRDAIRHVDQAPQRRHLLIDGREVHPSADVRRICVVA